ncbi:cyanophycinase [Shewanella sp. JM162201]|uniref:Cyanophycinase n=1 Tax=Shewanella jiangmenensis TaxID=2837387 RepID=A0ABS5V5D0_9GAMM|nr:cyanophycinase [Shewanella jiangmenensis]MBT1444826.1 cyanophycinase [Shewanella jiangmenensis]
MNQKKPIFFSALATVLAITGPSLSANDDSQQPLSLMLAGGALSVCSSMSPRHCAGETRFGSDAKTETRYELNPQSLSRLKSTAPWQQLDNATKTTLEHKFASAPAPSVNEDGLDNWLGELATTLSDSAYFALKDALELAQLDERGQRKQEQVLLERGNIPHGANHFKTFVRRTTALTGKQVPTIGIVTASARDPFEAADFYLQVFTQAGAKAVWLPLDGAAMHLWQSKDDIAQSQDRSDCTQLAALGERLNGYYQRARIYPDHVKTQNEMCRNPAMLSQMLGSLDGLFLSGGDQSLALAAWLLPDGNPSPALALIKQRLADGKLVIGGTSAGTAVMASGAMITGGTSQGALEQGVKAAAPVSERCETLSCDAPIAPNTLTYRPGGGLGLYPFGVTDTHFSEREREIRLVLLQDATGTGLAVGVDENTALWLSRDGLRGEIHGEGGVWFSEPVANKPDNQDDHKDESSSQNRGSNHKRPKDHSSHRVHYLPAGSDVALNGESLTLLTPPKNHGSAACGSLTPQWLAASGAKLAPTEESLCLNGGYYYGLQLVHPLK